VIIYYIFIISYKHRYLKINIKNKYKMLNNNYLLILVISLIVSGIFTYTFYNNVFTNITNHYSYTNLLIHKLLFVIIVVVISSVFIYIFYDYIFTTINCDYGLGSIVRHKREGIAVLMSFLPQIETPVNGYVFNMTNSEIFFDLLDDTNNVLGVGRVDGRILYVIKIGQNLHSIDPNLIRFLFYSIM
jgi:hypothetical protein